MIGIYCIVDRKGRIYVGSAVNIEKRWQSHKRTLRNNTHKNPKLQAAYNKYGLDAFTFHILELVPDGRDVGNNGKTKLINAEQRWINALFASTPPDKIYNICQFADSSIGVKRKPLSDEARKNLSEAGKGRVVTKETREKISESLTGRKRPESLKQRLRECNLGRKHSEETRRKISIAQKGKNNASKWSKDRVPTPEMIRKREETKRLNRERKKAA